MQSIASFVLAGGKSSRMGKDKAFLQLGGSTLLQRAVTLAASISNEVCIVGERQKFQSFGPGVEDVFPGCGPLGGIHGALSSTASELNLMLAVDLPLVEPEFLRYLVLIGQESMAEVTVPRAAGRLQPLCAVYRREFADTAERSLRGGRNGIEPLFAGVRTRVIEEAELADEGFSPNMFRNLNTPEEFARAEEEMRNIQRSHYP